MPTEKARRADVDGRARRVYSFLAKAGAHPAWVAAEFPGRNFSEMHHSSSGAAVMLSPAALEHRQVGVL